MGRTVSSNLQKMLDLAGCETQTTLVLNLQDTTHRYFSTKEVTIGGQEYTDDLLTTSELKQTAFASPDRVTASIQNIDKTIGETVTAEELIKAEAIVGRLYIDPRGILSDEWVELFRGELKPTQLDEAISDNEVLNDLAAAGYCVADRSLGDNCQLRYKGPKCGFAGAMATCNKKRRSPEGCQGHIVTGIVTNEHRFGGMEFPDPVLPDAPAGGGDPPPDPPPNCPRVDQWVPVRGEHGFTAVKLAMGITTEDETYCPVCHDCHRVRSVEIVKNQPIWETATRNMARGFSSFSHPIIRSETDRHGRPCSLVDVGEPVLTWLGHGLHESKAQRSEAAGETGDVIRIELEGNCKLYCYGNSRSGPFIVGHNAKPIG